MNEQEPMIQCPKGCGTSLPLSQMHDHYENCKGKPINPLDVIPIWPSGKVAEAVDGLTPKRDSVDSLKSTSYDLRNRLSVSRSNTIPSAPVDTLPPIQIDQPKTIKEENITPSYCKKCGTKYIVTSFYRACTKCETLSVRKRFFWFLMLRYGLMITALALSVGFILGISTYHSVIHP